ncbi:MAG: glycosyltransferase family 4 protein, partial [Steroidobacteraceae bacterium]
RRQMAVANLPSMLAYLPSAGLRATKLRRARTFDIVNTHFAVPTGPVGQWIANRYRIPNVLSVHGGDLFDPSKKLSPHRYGLVRVLIRRLLRRADALVAQSKDTLANISQIYGVRRDVELVPLGIERPPRIDRVPAADFGLPSGAFVLVTVGRLVPRKQTTQLVSALAASGVPRAHLLVAGSGPEESAIRRAAVDLGVAGRVHFLGAVRDSDKFRALAAADVFVSASQHEGFGLVFLEAMALGLPIICYNKGGQTDYLTTGETGHVVPLGDVKTFAGAIRQLSEAAEDRRRFGEANRRLVEEFLIERCAARYEVIFERSIAACSARRNSVSVTT